MSFFFNLSSNTLVQPSLNVVQGLSLSHKRTTHNLLSFCKNDNEHKVDISNICKISLWNILNNCFLNLQTFKTHFPPNTQVFAITNLNEWHVKPKRKQKITNLQNYGLIKSNTTFELLGFSLEKRRYTVLNRENPNYKGTNTNYVSPNQSNDNLCTNIVHIGKDKQSY